MTRLLLALIFIGILVGGFVLFLLIEWGLRIRK